MKFIASALAAIVIAAISMPASARGWHGGGGYRGASGGTRLYSAPSSRSTSSSTTRVRTYTTKGGSSVPTHNRTTADSSWANNWSTRGNVNPETSKKGYVDPTKATR